MSRAQSRCSRESLRALVVIALAMTLGACSIIRQDVGQPLVIDEGEIREAADYGEVLKMLGPPHRLSVSDSGMIFLYEEIDLLERQAGINLSSGNFALFKAVAGRGLVERRVLLLSFDAEGRTRAVQYEEREEAVAQGAALQFIFAVAGVVDDDHLHEPPRAHDWGFGLLEADLPRALNSAQQVDSNGQGVQQQGTPTTVGQQTLELRL